MCVCVSAVQCDCGRVCTFVWVFVRVRVYVYVCVCMIDLLHVFWKKNLKWLSELKKWGGERASERESRCESEWQRGGKRETVDSSIEKERECKRKRKIDMKGRSKEDRITLKESFMFHSPTAAGTAIIKKSWNPFQYVCVIVCMRAYVRASVHVCVCVCVYVHRSCISKHRQVCEKV